MKHKIQVVMLATEDKTNIKLDPDGVRLWYDSTPISTEIHTHQHLYITVSQDVEPIKEGDWYLDIDGYTIARRTLSKNQYEGCRKIIASTDPKLTITTSATGHTETRSRTFTSTKLIPQLEQSFIEEFVANPDGEFEIKYETKTLMKPADVYVEEVKTKLKLNQDNTVNITSVEEKMYSRKELIGNQDGSFDHFLLHSSKYTQEQREVAMNAVYNWIKKTL